MTTTHHHNVDAKLGEGAVVIAGITAVVSHLVSEAGFVVRSIDYVEGKVVGRIDAESVTVSVDEAGYGDMEIVIAPVSKKFGSLRARHVDYMVDKEVSGTWSEDVFRELREVFVNF